MSRSFQFFFAGILAFLVVSLPAFAEPATKPDYSGNYVLAGKRTDRAFFLAVELKDRRAKVNFSASMVDGSGASPDADGTGKVQDDVLNFKFKDSFDNEGTCKLKLLPGTSIYQLDMVVTKVVEPSPLHFYGTLQLTKTKAGPTSQ
jgi:hypothetical protein